LVEEVCQTVQSNDGIEGATTSRKRISPRFWCLLNEPNIPSSISPGATSIE